MNAITIVAASLLALSSIEPAQSAPNSNSDGDRGSGGESAVAGVSISSTVDGRTGAVVYNGEKVWEGRVRKELTAIAEALGGKYGDCAAAWDGKKVVWENKPGAAAALRHKLEQGARRKPEE